MHKLITFLSATSEFNEEVKRIQKIKINLLKFPSEEANYQLKKIINFAEWFKIEAKKNLGKFTANTSSFLKTHENLYKKQENYFFCGRKESEYHLNMTGAEIMNRSLRKKFTKTKEKILLLPTCMCESENCNAIKVNNDLLCTHCNPNCHVSMITKKMKQNSVKTVLIKHSSSFSKWLKPWSGQSKTGLIGVACVLNLLTGGFEMKRLGIPSQCIFLDFPGCKKHWKTGIPTRLDSLKACNICKKEISDGLKPVVKSMFDLLALATPEWVEQNKLFYPSGVRVNNISKPRVKTRGYYCYSPMGLLKDSFYKSFSGDLL